MHRLLPLWVVAVAGFVTVLGAQNPAPAQGGGIKLSDVAGTWDTKSFVGAEDSAVTSIMTVAADGKSWTLTLTGRDPIPVRVVAFGGDSIVTEAGPYRSILRPGLSVTRLRNVGHYAGNRMTGTFEAHYSTGDVITGRVEATRR